MEIRPAEVEDLQEICDLELKAYGQHAYNYIILRQLIDLTGTTFLVAEEEYILGFIIAARANIRKQGWILNLLVNPENRKSGVGSKLTEEALRRMGQLGLSVIQLTVSPANIAAHRLYTTLGFAEDRFEKNYFGPGKDRLVMQKILG